MQNNPTTIAVVAVALGDDDDRWLMHRRPFEKQHGGLWEFPGGKVDPGESPPDALVREICEELGIAVRADDLVPTCSASSMSGSATPSIVIDLYTCKVWEGLPEALEGGQVGWFTPPEIARLAKPPLDCDLAASLFADLPG